MRIPTPAAKITAQTSCISTSRAGVDHEQADWPYNDHERHICYHRALHRESKSLELDVPMAGIWKQPVCSICHR